MSYLVAFGTCLQLCLGLACQHNNYMHGMLPTFLQEEPTEVIDPLVTLKLLDASAATAAARQVVRAGPALHDGLAAEPELKEGRLRALAGAQDTSMVSEHLLTV